MSFRILQLLLQDSGVVVHVDRVFFKALIFLHGLVVQILAIHNEKHLVDIGKLRGKLRRLERSQRLATACGMPDIAACFDAARLFIIGRQMYPVQNPLRRGDLVGTHYQQQVFRCEHTISGKNSQNYVLGKERLGKVYEVGDLPLCISHTTISFLPRADNSNKSIRK